MGCPLHVGARLQRGSQMQASTCVAPPLGSLLGLNLVWGCTWHRYGMSCIQSHEGCGTQPLLQNLYPAPTFPSHFLRNTLAFSIACKSSSGFLAYCFPLPPVFGLLASFQSSALVRSSSCGSLAFCSSDRHRPLLLTQASRLETQDCPPHHAPRKQHETVFRNWGSLWLCSRAPAQSGTL